MKKPLFHPGHLLYLALLLFPAISAEAQRVGFGLYSSYDLTLTRLVPEDLEFGEVTSGEGVVSIDITDTEVVPIEIEGVAYLDVTVTLTPPLGGVLLLEGDDENLGDEDRSMPVTITMAYYNGGDPNIPIDTAKSQAIEVTGDMATFAIRRRPGGPPGPPPVPPHAGYIPPTAVAYLFIYGSLTVGDVDAGPYSGTIDIHVEYSTYD